MGNNPIKYVDPDGEYTYDSHNKHRILANLDDRNDLIKAAELLLAPDMQYTITAYGETSGITKIFNTYSELNDYLYSGDPSFEYKLFETGQRDGKGAKALFTEGYIVKDVANGSFNLDMEMGVASYESSKKFFKDKQFNLGFTGRASGMASSLMIGLDGNLLGASADAYIFKGGGSIDITLWGITFSVGGDAMLGGIGGGFLFGSNGFGASLDIGVGAELRVTWRKEYEEF